ncbi:MAG: autotransporter domain-containing protein [Endomicrobium sp.]|jgi:hypothetical protein|nr:autotransporter domain-containing protein [Endomicrobium sp.]
MEKGIFMRLAKECGGAGVYLTNIKKCVIVAVIMMLMVLVEVVAVGEISENPVKAREQVEAIKREARVAADEASRLAANTIAAEKALIERGHVQIQGWVENLRTTEDREGMVAIRKDLEDLCKNLKNKEAVLVSEQTESPGTAKSDAGERKRKKEMVKDMLGAVCYLAAQSEISDLKKELEKFKRGPNEKIKDLINANRRVYVKLGSECDDLIKKMKETQFFNDVANEKYKRMDAAKERPNLKLSNEEVIEKVEQTIAMFDIDDDELKKNLKEKFGSIESVLEKKDVDMMEKLEELSKIVAKIDDAKQFLNRFPKAENLSFIANMIMSGARRNSNDNRDVYSKLTKREDELLNSGLWGQYVSNYSEYDGGQCSSGKYIDREHGCMIGIRGYVSDNVVLGGYLKGSRRIAVQNGNSGNITSVIIGLCGGYIEEKWEIKGIIRGCFDGYSIKLENEKKRFKNEEDFQGYGFGFDIEGMWKIKISEVMKLNPYLGLDLSEKKYYDVKEWAIKSGRYGELLAKVGMEFNVKLNKNDFRIGVAYERLLSCETPKIKLILKRGTNKYIEGIDSGKNIGSVRIGWSCDIIENVELYVNIGYSVAKKFRNLNGNSGISYRF